MAEMSGRPVQIGGREFIVPRATVADAKRVGRVASDFASGDAADVLVAQIVAMLSKNYPGLSAAELEDIIPIADLLDTHKQCLTAAGFRPEESTGEAGSP